MQHDGLDGSNRDVGGRAHHRRLLAYGLLTRSAPMVLANTATLLLASYILSVKLHRG